MILRALFFLIMILIYGQGVFADTPPVVNTNIYDANGNLVSGDGRYYEYNDANQLARVRQGDQAGAVIAEYFYDSSGQRIKKIENGVVTYYVGKHFEKQVGGTNAGNSSYYFGNGGERVARKDPAGQIFYYHLDHLDGVNVVTNSAGTPVSTTDYLPFGDARAGGTGNEKYAYTGKEQDKTGLYYFDARYNSPEFRHFTQADVAEPDYDDPQDLNRYAYVGNNPTSYVDPDGFKKKKKSKKQAKLSKREKWMIAHGTDPDHDKTTLKKAKQQFLAGKKYTLPAPQSGPAVASGGQQIDAQHATQYGAKSNLYTKANMQRLRYMYEYSAALAGESAYWDAWGNTLEGVHGALQATKNLFMLDFGGVGAESSRMIGTLFKSAGMNKNWTLGANIIGAGIDIYGGVKSIQDYSRAFDGRTTQSKILFKEEFSWSSEVPPQSSDFAAGSVNTVFEGVKDGLESFY